MRAAPTIPIALRERMRLRAWRYAFTYLGPLIGLAGLMGHGLMCWFFPIYGFILIPIAELLKAPDPVSLTEEEEQAALQDPFFDLLLYAIVPIHWALTIYFLFTISDPALPLSDLLGRITTMGVLCGVYGINVAHELGHRATRWERDLARTLLLSSLYMHFIVEHNRGHHRYVATPEDPASARCGENIYAFWFRTIVFSFISAWRIEVARLRREGVAPYGMQNEMIRFVLLEMGLMLGILLFFGPTTLLAFVAAAFIGILLLETVNYVEHYGLRRQMGTSGTYRKVEHVHSWNSDHVIGRLMLFELTRHSDHHYRASRKYQALRSVPDGPQLPTGYPGMMLLSLVPPLWFRVMDPLLRRSVEQHEALALAR